MLEPRQQRETQAPARPKMRRQGQGLQRRSKQPAELYQLCAGHNKISCIQTHIKNNLNFQDNTKLFMIGFIPCCTAACVINRKCMKSKSFCSYRRRKINSYTCANRYNKKHDQNKTKVSCFKTSTCNILDFITSQGGSAEGRMLFQNFRIWSEWPR